jgi:hypothetical protein
VRLTGNLRFNRVMKEPNRDPAIKCHALDRCQRVFAIDLNLLTAIALRSFRAREPGALKRRIGLSRITLAIPRLANGINATLGINRNWHKGYATVFRQP